MDKVVCNLYNEIMNEISPFLSPEEQKEAVANSKNKKPKTKKITKKPNTSAKNKIPVSIFTGYLGAGKTTVITNLMKSMGSDYKIAWLKNEIGSTGVDTELANLKNTAVVKEMLQGCICHVMISALGDALDELLLSKPDRIIIETSGSSTPAPVVFEIKKDPRLKVDGIITVIDAENFSGYLDKSFTLKLQAKYTDLILINKWESLDEKTLEDNLDDIYEINLDTPKIFTDRGRVNPEIVFGLATRAFSEAEAVTDFYHQEMEVDLIEILPQGTYSKTQLEAILKNYPKKKFYRIKGVVKSTDGYFVINYAFGKFEIVKIDKKNTKPRIVFMGEEIESFKSQINKDFNNKKQDFKFKPRHAHH